MDCMLFTFDKQSSAHALGGLSGMALFITIKNSFNKTEAAIFPMQALLP